MKRAVYLYYKDTWIIAVVVTSRLRVEQVIDMMSFAEEKLITMFGGFDYNDLKLVYGEVYN